MFDPNLLSPTDIKSKKVICVEPSNLRRLYTLHNPLLDMLTRLKSSLSSLKTGQRFAAKVADVVQFRNRVLVGLAFNSITCLGECLSSPGCTIYGDRDTPEAEIGTL